MGMTKRDSDLLNVILFLGVPIVILLMVLF